MDDRIRGDIASLGTGWLARAVPLAWMLSCLGMVQAPARAADATPTTSSITRLSSGPAAGLQSRPRGPASLPVAWWAPCPSARCCELVETLVPA